MSQNSSNNENFISTNAICNDSDCVMRKLREYLNKETKIDNIPILSDSLYFQLEILKQLENLRLDNIVNISSKQLFALKNFQKHKPFKVVELDKNIGTGIISNDLYNNLILTHLNNQLIYTKIDGDTTNEIIDKINNTLFDLMENSLITKKIYSILLVTTAKLGNIRILPKLHKEKFSIRPIINYTCHPTNNLCVLFDLILKPLYAKSETFIKDSQNLIKDSIDLKFNKYSSLYSCDFEALYSNINHEDCLNVITEFISKHFDFEEIRSAKALRSLFELVLDNNYFKYDDLFYKQIKGIAMGSKCGPSIANIYLYVYEKRWLKIEKPLFYKRFIDDIFLITNCNRQIETLKSSFKNLTLNCVSDSIVNFLDLNISLDKAS